MSDSKPSTINRDSQDQAKRDWAWLEAIEKKFLSIPEPEEIAKSYEFATGTAALFHLEDQDRLRKTKSELMRLISAVRQMKEALEHIESVELSGTSHDLTLKSLFILKARETLARLKNLK